MLNTDLSRSDYDRLSKPTFAQNYRVDLPQYVVRSKHYGIKSPIKRKVQQRQELHIGPIGEEHYSTTCDMELSDKQSQSSSFKSSTTRNSHINEFDLRRGWRFTSRLSNPDEIADQSPNRSFEGFLKSNSSCSISSSFSQYGEPFVILKHPSVMINDHQSSAFGLNQDMNRKLASPHSVTSSQGSEDNVSHFPHSNFKPLFLKVIRASDQLENLDPISRRSFVSDQRQAGRVRHQPRRTNYHSNQNSIIEECIT